MSVIDSYILMIDMDEGAAMASVNATLRSDFSTGEFKQVDSQAGGVKWFCADVWMIATNHFLLPDMARLLCSAPWSDPSVLRLAHLGEADEHFEFYTLEQLAKLVDEELP